ncbi:hypothetical protein BGX38DRAFT_1144354 [Terfezia claveryi]|nr:hypothetical protein BGX38DRAFT_1280937 [Terfezia claveryi]KAF8441192.1 hypothetical protein BGX38DRAFT_1144354 [Terfezia claveryi]
MSSNAERDPHSTVNSPSASEEVSANEAQQSPTASRSSPGASGITDPLDMVAIQLKLASLEGKSPAASVKSNTSEHSRVSICSPISSVKESNYLRVQPGPLQFLLVENSPSAAHSLAGSIKERSGSSPSIGTRQPQTMTGSTTELFSISSGSTDSSGSPSRRAPSISESLLSNSGTIESFGAQRSRTPSVAESLKSSAASIKELFSGTSGSTRESPRSNHAGARRVSSISSADAFRQDCTTRAEKVKEALSRMPSTNTPGKPKHRSDSGNAVTSPGKKKARKIPDVSPLTAKLVFAVAQSMGGPEMPEGLIEKLEERRSRKK